MELKLTLLFGMLFLHIVDDYYLQGCLASAKQRRWWEKNCPNEMYKNDYIMALCEHAFSWTFMIMLIPMLWGYFHDWENYSGWIILFAYNWTMHSVVDNYKANLKTINLVQDQLFHMFQVLITWIFTIFIF